MQNSWPKQFSKVSLSIGITIIALTLLNYRNEPLFFIHYLSIFMYFLFKFEFFKSRRLIF